MEDKNQNPIQMESLTPVMRRSIALLLIHDMLPWNMDEPGMTLTEIQQRLARVGVDRSVHTLNQDLGALMTLARVHFDDENARPRRFHRFHSQRLTDHMPDPIRTLATPALAVRDWPSEILIER